MVPGRFSPDDVLLRAGPNAATKRDVWFNLVASRHILWRRLIGLSSRDPPREALPICLFESAAAEEEKVDGGHITIKWARGLLRTQQSTKSNRKSMGGEDAATIKTIHEVDVGGQGKGVRVG